MHFREMISYQRRDPKILTQAEREARKVFAAQEAEKALSEYELAPTSLPREPRAFEGGAVSARGRSVENIVSRNSG